MCIRRVNLDTMWSRETNTVSSNLSRLQQDYRKSMLLGHDNVRGRAGMKCALLTLNASLRAGKYADHLHERAVFAAYKKLMCMCMSEAPTSSKWFPSLMLGAKRRMGIIRKQNEALTSDDSHVEVGGR
ncbi:hypothetical protein ACHAXR_005111 [Thalassiosira sp. AJA248-18]